MTTPAILQTSTIVLTLLVVEDFIDYPTPAGDSACNYGPYSCENPMFVGCQMSYRKLNR